MEITQQNGVDGATSMVSEVATLPSIGALWRASWSFIGGNFWRLVLVSVLGVLLNVAGLVMSFILAGMVERDEVSVALLYGTATVTAVATILGTVFSMALMSVATIHGKDRSLSVTWSMVMNVVWVMAGTVFLAYAVMAAGFIFLIVPGVILSVLLLPVLWVIVEERLSYRAALTRSIALVTGRWWAVWWRLVVAMLFMVALILGVMIAAALLVPVFITVGMVNGTVALVLGALIAVVGYVLMSCVLGFFLMRYSYELYRGLAATVAPTAHSWWQGLPLTILLVVGSFIGVAYLIAMPHLLIVDLKEESNPPRFSTPEKDFGAWLEANPDFLEEINTDMIDIESI